MVVGLETVLTRVHIYACAHIYTYTHADTVIYIRTHAKKAHTRAPLRA